MSDVGVSGFYTILGYSLPRYDLQLHVEHKYTIVQTNTQFFFLPCSTCLGETHIKIRRLVVQNLKMA